MNFDNQKYGVSFCVFPFTQVNIRNDGKVRICCRMGEYVGDQNSQWTIYSHSISEIWNSEYMRNVRKRMIEGKRIKACTQCIARERYNKNASRISGSETRLKHINKTIEDIKSEALANNYKVTTLPSHYHLEITDKCNSKCRFCNPNSSRLIKKDIVQSAWTSMRLLHEDLDNRIKNSRFGNSDPWYSQSTLWKELFRDNLRWVYIIGGEPMIMKEQDEVLKYLIDNNFAQNTILSLNTNLSYASNFFSKNVHHFKHVNCRASIDASHDLYEYLRYPLKWQQTYSNLVKFSQYPSFSLSCALLISMYNFLYLVDFFRILDQHKIPLRIIILQSPEFLSASIAPPSARKEASRKLKKYVETECSEKNRDKVEAIIKFIDNAPNDFKDHPERLYTFNLYNNDLDETRKQSFKQVCPELFEYLKKDGYIWSDSKCFSFLRQLKRNLPSTCNNINIKKVPHFIQKYEQVTNIKIRELEALGGKNKHKFDLKTSTRKILGDLKGISIEIERMKNEVFQKKHTNSRC
jgi:organic radical activating enzyme